MQEKEFNLLDEPWIRVLRRDGRTEEVSLTDALLGAHEYVDLAGETPTQDVAVLRLLLAVLHTVFARVNIDGTESPLLSWKRAFGRWKKLWENGALPKIPILNYLDQWHERFWLFHPERPFWQVPEAEIGTEYGAAKLNGEVLESGNKLRLFSPYAGTEKTKMSYAQAARWLLYVNGFDDTSAKPKKTTDEKLPSPGAGWLGKLGLITLLGDNLFETLLLNLVLLKDGKTLWNEEGRECPCWELERARSAQRTEIPVPDNAAQLLTLQSRRLLLYREGGKVIGYRLLGGDFFSKEDFDAEQMTIWGKVHEKKKDAPIKYQPRRHDPARQIWRELPDITGGEEKDVRQPGVIRWGGELKHRRLYEKSLTRCRIVSAVYGDKDFFVNDTFSDTLTLHADLLTELGRKWQKYITIEIEKSEEVAGRLGYLAKELELSAGGEGKKAAEKARREFYFAVDMPFRAWLRGIDPQRMDAEDGEAILSWRKQIGLLARRQAETMVLQAGPTAFSGRMVKEKRNGKDVEHYYSAPDAMNRFLAQLYVIYKTE